MKHLFNNLSENEIKDILALKPKVKTNESARKY